MEESDFSQFDDPRVRAAFAAAANLVECLRRNGRIGDVPLDQKVTKLTEALFAAQHSKPMCPICEEMVAKAEASDKSAFEYLLDRAEKEECPHCGSLRFMCQGKCVAP